MEPCQEDPAYQQAQLQVADLLKRIQDISLDLRPAMLDDLGLLPAILWHAQHYEARTKIKVHFYHAGLSQKRFDPQVETACYRIVQEALTNTARHAQAKSIRLKVEADGENITIEVEDTGKGFNPQKALSSRHSSGLTGMRERAALLGGELMFDSSAGNGAVIRAKLPCNPQGKYE